MGEDNSLQTTDYAEWEEIGEEVKRVRKDLVSLVDALNSVPKTVWRDEFEKAEDGMSELKDVLEERMFKEHPEKAETDVFYGGIDDER